MLGRAHATVAIVLTGATCIAAAVTALPAQAVGSTISFSTVTTGTIVEDEFVGGVAAIFSDSAHPSPVASDYGATFDWGDGTVYSTASNTATISCPGSQPAGSCELSVSGHSYADEGVFTVTATVFPAGDSATSPTAASTTGTLTTGEADSFTGSGTAVSGSTGVALSGVQTATFTDPNSASTAAEFTSTVDWGDGTTTAGTVTGSAGTFAVSGTHTYAAPGLYTVSSTITDPAPGTATATVTSTATIGAQTISFTAPASATVGGSDPLVATGGGSGSPVVFSVDPTTTNSACTASGVNGATVTYLHPGSCVIDANQAGDANYLPASQVVQIIAVGKATPVVTLTVSPVGGSVIGQTVGLTASVAGVTGGGAPTGTVSFTAGGASISGCANVPLSGGSASCSTSTLGTGLHALAAAYSGNGDYAANSAALAYPVGLITTATTVRSTVNPAVSGQGVTFTATISPAPSSGVVQWLVDGSVVGAPVPVSAGAVQLGPISSLGVGSHVISAQYLGDATHASSADTMTEVVSKAATTTTVAAHPSTLTATVAPVAPGAGVPTGTVVFAVAGTAVGTASVGADGMAVLSHPATAGRTVSVVYSGDSAFTGSSGSTTPTNPTITAVVISAHRKTAAGWYRSAVKIGFSCSTNGAPLMPPGCPAPVTIRTQGAAQSVTRTIHATDGGVASVTVSPINIDRAGPRVAIKGINAGRTYAATGPQHLRCVAHDKLSGLAAPCQVRRHRHGHRVTVVAIARDRAGNLTRAVAHYRIS